MEIRRIKLDKLKPNDWNPNEMPESTFAHLKREYDRIGFLQPILVRPKDDYFQIVDGEHRFFAAKEMEEIKEIVCIVKEMSREEAQITTINMNDIKGADNPLKMAELINELQETQDQEALSELINKSVNELEQFNILLDLPSDEEIDEMLNESEEGTGDEAYSITFNFEREEDLELMEEALDMSNRLTKEGKILEIAEYFTNKGLDETLSKS